MIENNGLIDMNFGNNPSNFDEDNIISEFNNIPNPNGRYNNSSCPFIIDKKIYHKIDGYDEDFSNVGAELGLAKRLWDIGISNIGLETSSSLVYHFQSTTISRINRAEMAKYREEKFKEKYNMNPTEFRKEIKKGNTHLWN